MYGRQALFSFVMIVVLDLKGTLPCPVFYARVRFHCVKLGEPVQLSFVEHMDDIPWLAGNADPLASIVVDCR